MSFVNLLNNTQKSVDDYLESYVESHRELLLLRRARVVFRRDLSQIRGKVALISGGGSGHEPAFVSWVGKKLLSAVVLGDVFTSPSASSVTCAIRAVHSFEPCAILLIVLNYTGDKANFGIAQQWAVAQGIAVEMVIVDEDCASASLDRGSGRRGLAGAALVAKVAGALAQRGTPMSDLKQALEKVVRNMGTIGVCFRPCVLPGSSSPSFEVKPGTMELGLGIHGEAGVKRVTLSGLVYRGGKKLKEEKKVNKEEEKEEEEEYLCPAIVRVMVDHMTNEESSSHIRLRKNDSVALLLNNLGGTTGLEMGAFAKAASAQMRMRGVEVARLYSDVFISSLQMCGFSITVLKLNDDFGDLDFLPLLDTPTTLQAFHYFDPSIVKENICLSDLDKEVVAPKLEEKIRLGTAQSSIFKFCVVASCEALIRAKEVLNTFDQGGGDGDCGFTHAAGAQAVLKVMQQLNDYSRPATILQTIGQACEKMGGSSGAMYNVFMNTAAYHMAQELKFTQNSIANSIGEGVKAIQVYGGARVGDRTMLDVLVPICEVLKKTHKDVNALCDSLVRTATQAAQDTLKMEAKAGRASQVAKEQLKYPDPGAAAVAEIIKACASVLKK